MENKCKTCGHHEDCHKDIKGNFTRCVTGDCKCKKFAITTK